MSYFEISDVKTETTSSRRIYSTKKDGNQ